jgi:hypothetical protein
MATCSYNGVVFTSLYRSRISSRPVLDEAQRTVVYVEHTLEIDGYITPSINSVDAKWEIIRQDLTAVGGELLYYDKGFGELIVNSTLRLVRDVKWGPIPEIVDFYPLGGDCNAARIRWRCTTRIPECADAKYRDALLAYNYDATYTIDQDGYTTLRVAGYIEVPMARDTVRTRTLPDSVDRYRVLLNSPAPLGFQRKTRTFRISQDKRRLDFNYTEEEIYSPLPDRVTSIQARQSVRNINIGFQHWSMTIDATITMARGTAKHLALAAFLNLVFHRQEKVIALAANSDKTSIIPQELSIDDDIYGKSTRFSYTCKITTPKSITALLEAARVWHQADDWGKWRTSLETASASTMRGYANLELKKEDDAIIDLCLPSDQLIPRDRSKPPKADNPRLPADSEKKAGLKEPVRPQNSWLEYENSLEYSEEPGVVVHQTLPRDPPAGGGGSAPPGAGNPGGTGIPPGKFVVGPPIGGGAAAMPDAAGSASGIRNATSTGAVTPQGSAPPAVIQYRSATMRYVRMRGYAARLGWKPVVPRLVSVGGQAPIEIKRVVSEHKGDGTLFLPMFEVEWIIDYVLPSAPSSLPHLANPVYDHDGGNGAQQTLRP